MSHDVHPVLAQVAKNAQITTEEYHRDYQRALNDPQAFWAAQGKKFITWFQTWETVLSGDFSKGDIQWYTGGKLNAAFNCLDRHLETRGNQTAIIWESDSPNKYQTITYRDLHDRVCRFANVLRSFNVKKGDRVCIYLPMIPEVAVAMLACARIGAIHSVVFAGFAKDALKDRILDAKCKLVITANEGVRNNKLIPLKENVDKALKDCPEVRAVIVVKRTENSVPWDSSRDYWFHNLVSSAPLQCRPEFMSSTDPLFILYTSGSTGKPKGIQHATGGYLVYAAMTQRLVFDYGNREIFWCTADVGWITGHTYSLYGPLLNGGTTVMFEGTPEYPTPARIWEIVDRHKVNILYTAPTALRALRRQGDSWVTKTKRDSLRILGTVGEPINAEAWEWYFHVVGNNKCPIVDTWWQTETGGVMITPFPGATPMKPGFASWPFFGIVPRIVDDAGNELPAGEMGKLVISQPWPGIAQTIYNDHERFVTNYFTEFPGNYSTGDLAYCDADGYFWIAGRSDDVIKVSGHRIGSQDVENALVDHRAVSEAAVVPIPDEIKGQAIFAFVTLKKDIAPTEILRGQLVQKVRDFIGAIATPKEILWVEQLPKTRSGKILRRVLRKMAVQEFDNLGDLSTLTDPGVVEEIKKSILKK